MGSIPYFSSRRGSISDLGFENSAKLMNSCAGSRFSRPSFCPIRPIWIANKPIEFCHGCRIHTELNVTAVNMSFTCVKKLESSVTMTTPWKRRRGPAKSDFFSSCLLRTAGIQISPNRRVSQDLTLIYSQLLSMICVAYLYHVQRNRLQNFHIPYAKTPMCYKKVLV